MNRPKITIEIEGDLRYWVPSNTDPSVKYLVELDAYNGNGLCSCPHSQITCQKLLSRNISPQEAVDQNLIKLKVNRHVEDALRCEHLITARNQLCDDFILEIIKLRKRKQSA